MVGASRFELLTPGPPCQCATRLRHAPMSYSSTSWPTVFFRCARRCARNVPGLSGRWGFSGVGQSTKRRAFYWFPGAASRCECPVCRIPRSVWPRRGGRQGSRCGGVSRSHGQNAACGPTPRVPGQWSRWPPPASGRTPRTGSRHSGRVRPPPSGRRRIASGTPGGRRPVRGPGRRSLRSVDSRRHYVIRDPVHPAGHWHPADRLSFLRLENTLGVVLVRRARALAHRSAVT